MTETATEAKTTGSEVAKTEDPIAMLAKLSVQNSEAIAKLTETQNKILSKLEDANPVEHGARLEAKPTTDSDKDAGAPITATNDYGRSTQASIIAPAGKPSGSDKDGLSMENKSVPEAKLDPVYKEIPAVRPAFIIKAEQNTVVPTAMQVLKAIDSGWDGKFKKAEDSYIEAVRRLEAGEFGTGFPRGYL